MRSPLPLRALGGLAALALTVTACGDGDATRDDLAQALIDVSGFSDEEAECVAAAIYDSGEWTQDQLNSVGGGLENDDGTEKVEGFTAAFDAAIEDCTSPS